MHQMNTACRGLATRRLFASVRLQTSRARNVASISVPYRTENFINNEWRATAKTLPVFDPATEEELFHVANSSTKDVDDAIRGAHEAFHGPHWGKASKGKDRGDMLRRMAALLKEQREDFAVLETMDNGKPINESRADIDVCIALFDYYAGFADTFDEDRTTPVKITDKDFAVRLVKEPVGVVGMVTPWNFPLMQAVAKVAPALATGCSMVLKPSSVCPATSLRLGDISLAAGLPPGALNIISGTGREAGNALLEHRLVDFLSFTGSSGVGETVLNAAAKKLTPSCVELGGKGAVVVFDDVDIESAVDWVMVGIFICAGQTCSATSRLIIHEAVYDKFMDRLIKEVGKLKMGDPLAESTNLGSLTTPEQLKIVDGFVQRAKADGAEVLCGGNAASVNGKGSFYEATILRTPKDCEAWQEEIFGPVLAVRSFATEAEAVRMANDTPYGLGNAVLSVDAERCERVAQQLHAGVVWKNCSNVIPTEAPFGGFGKSGFGKEYGALGFEEFLQTKVITECEPTYSWEWYVARGKQ